MICVQKRVGRVSLFLREVKVVLDCMRAPTFATRKRKSWLGRQSETKKVREVGSREKDGGGGAGGRKEGQMKRDRMHEMTEIVSFY